MTYCIPVDKGILCMSKVEFNCPACGEEYHEEDYYNQLDKSKRGYIYKHCKKCAAHIGISSNIMGDVVVWLKSEEQ